MKDFSLVAVVVGCVGCASGNAKQSQTASGDSRPKPPVTRGLPSGTSQQMGPVFFDPLGADFAAWLQQFKKETYRNWIPPQAPAQETKGHVDIEFTVNRDGALSQCRILTSSGNPALDESAKNSLESSMFLPLPSDFGPKDVTVRVSFWCNERPPQ